jgi:hypothetical protein
MFSNIFVFENPSVYEINVEKYVGTRGATSDVTTWRMHVAFWPSKAT